jgi:hypothetical protein
MKEEKLESGKLKIENGKLKIENGKWKIAETQFLPAKLEVNSFC